MCVCLQEAEMLANLIAAPAADILVDGDFVTSKTSAFMLIFRSIYQFFVRV